MRFGSRKKSKRRPTSAPALRASAQSSKRWDGLATSKPACDDRCCCCCSIYLPLTAFKSATTKKTCTNLANGAPMGPQKKSMMSATKTVRDKPSPCRDEALMAKIPGFFRTTSAALSGPKLSMSAFEAARVTCSEMQRMPTLRSKAPKAGPSPPQTSTIARQRRRMPFSFDGIMNAFRQFGNRLLTIRNTSCSASDKGKRSPKEKPTSSPKISLSPSLFSS
mmetsp:Transcript_107535/g.342959  ORF Transcript_107535/g.342959 Transcript_107535/m.342959 type:complete len:221 (+) Transcript_107535:27-689(+)